MCQDGNCLRHTQRAQGACTIQALARAKTSPNLLGCYCSGPSVIPEDRRFWSTQGWRPGVLWQTANMGPKAAGLNAQRQTGEERDENPIIHSALRRLKYSAGQNPDQDYNSVVLVSVAGSLNATSLGRLFWPKLLLTMISRRS